MKQFKNLNIALVYDRVNKFGGAERVLLALRRIWPEAPLYTAVYDPAGASWAKDFQVIPSWIQHFPLAKKKHEIYPWLMPFAFESFDFSNFDLVISVTSAEAKGIVTKPETNHLCYCLTPTRYLWSSYRHYLSQPCYGLFNPLARLAMKPLLSRLRKWDQIAAQRPDCYLAISKAVQKRIKKYYKRQSKVIYPPVDTDKFKLTRSKPGQYFLAVSRLVSYKRVDIIIEAFNQLGWPLKIIGAGSEKKKLERRTRGKIEFLGQNLTDEELLRYYQNCRALVFAGKEDLGLVSLEAQACGRPVIAYRGGGLKETLIQGKTGVLFSSQSVSALKGALKKFGKQKFRPEDCRQNARRFSQEKFIKRFKKEVEERWEKQQKLNQK